VKTQWWELIWCYKPIDIKFQYTITSSRFRLGRATVNCTLPLVLFIAFYGLESFRHWTREPNTQRRIRNGKPLSWSDDITMMVKPHLKFRFDDFFSGPNRVLDEVVRKLSFRSFLRAAKAIDWTRTLWQWWKLAIAYRVQRSSCPKFNFLFNVFRRNKLRQEKSRK
jgi:hypothetical protein